MRLAADAGFGVPFPDSISGVRAARLRGPGTDRIDSIFWLCILWMEEMLSEHAATNETILVVGGGISGMTAALEAAETGKNVVLVEKNPALGGRTSQLYRYFPKMCHPVCGLA